MHRKTIHKATGFVTRRRGARSDILVFRHPHAGVQLPAGTVESGESVETAAIREIREETGLRDLGVMSHLGSMCVDLEDESRALLEPVTLQVGPRADAGSLGISLGRAHWVRVACRIDDFAEVVCEEVDINASPPRLRTRFSGWLPFGLLADRLERHFYHCEYTLPTAETWLQEADLGLTFACYWTPLVPKPELAEGQQEWMDEFHAVLVARATPGVQSTGA